MHPEIIRLFSDHKLRLTKPREAVFELLKKADRPLSHVELMSASPDMDKVSIYRTIETFIRLGIVTSVPHGWKQRYELAAPFRPHHHHFLCLQCDMVEEIESDQLEKMIQIFAQYQGFKVTGHTFEITGLCKKCSSDQ